jgi:hypothetical protein
MAIVHMHQRILRFQQQLEYAEDRIFPDPQYFDYDEGKEIYKYEEEEAITLPDFSIEFDLIITQVGTYDPGSHCQPPEFNEESTEVEIRDLIVFDSVYGEELRLNREEFTDIILKVKQLIEI